MIFSTGVSFLLIILTIEDTITFLKIDRAIRIWSQQNKHLRFSNTSKPSVKKVLLKVENNQHHNQALKTVLKICLFLTMICTSARYVRCLSNLIRIAKLFKSVLTLYIYYTFPALQSTENFMIIMEGTWYAQFAKKKFKIQTLVCEKNSMFKNLCKMYLIISFKNYQRQKSWVNLHRLINLISDHQT